MAKLKELLRPKTIEYLLDNNKMETDMSKMGYWKAKGIDCNEGWDEVESDFKSTVLSAKDCFFYNNFMFILKKKSPEYYESLQEEIKIKGAETEIDIKYLEDNFPMIKSLNNIFKVYGPEIIG